MSQDGISLDTLGRKSPPLPAGVLWDLDGTLVDTEPAWMAGERALALAYDSEWTETDALNVVGLALSDTAAYIRNRMKLTLSDSAIITELGAHVIAALETQISWRPGAFELFHHLAGHGVPQGLVTMSYRPIAQPVIDALNFQAIVTGDVVQHGKPHPEPYLRGAAQLGLTPGVCLAIEDSPTGTTSARTAGCQVLAVPNMVDVPAMPGQHSASTLRGITFTDLAELFLS